METLSEDGLLLGSRQGKTKITSELYAGFRAEIMASPINVALSTLGGRIGARVIKSMIHDKSIINYQKNRIDLMVAAVNCALPAGKGKVTLVDAPCGFSPLGFTLAQRYPQAQVLEMDLREIIQDKRNRLQRARDIKIPPNLTFIEADFRRTPLGKVLAEHHHPQVDVLTFSFNSFTSGELLRLSRYLRGLLTDQGAIICFGTWKPTNNQEQAVHNLIRRQTQDDWKVTFQDKTEAVDLFKQVGFSSVDVYLGSELSQFTDITEDISDVEIFIIARR
jgi:O-methyltransferase involved in polyketide biosynthesis